MNKIVISFVKVNVRRAVKGRNEMNVSISGENGHSSSRMGSLRPPIVRKSKLVVVDLAGSERIDKSGMFLIVPCLATPVFSIS
jgi:kinesin family member 5